MKIKHNAVLIILIVFIFGSFGITKALGIWSTERSKVPKKIEEGEFLGEYDPSDIRGSYSFKEISDVFDIEVEVLGDAFLVSDFENLDEFQCKELETIYEEEALSGYEIGTDSVRIFVALYNSLPIELNEDTYFTKEAVGILNENGNLSEEEKEYLNNHELNIKRDISEEEKEIEEVEEKEVESSDDFSVKGKTTFGELLDNGYKKEDIEALIGGEFEESKVIRDYCEDNGIEFSTIKTQLEEMNISD